MGRSPMHKEGRSPEESEAFRKIFLIKKAARRAKRGRRPRIKKIFSERKIGPQIQKS